MVFTGTGQFFVREGSLARTPYRSDWLKDILMLFGILPLRIFHVFMMIYPFLLHCRRAKIKREKSFS